ncbi:uncharacterized protein LOC129860174 isoform X7 [Salvelinus fontinalis]|uniref:uncharacterized protein LOC129860174 isoform X7 n=1 Tax=Salvelinus fontinalis TaxID=8038 RepID=UPI002485E0A1|nr:uncharacterized protein LOC129860174 isoform X7 [Salvelinus fontinalis]
MASVKLEDCSQTLELNVNIKDEEEEEKIGKSVSHGMTNPACLSPSTPSPNLQSLGPDHDSGGQFLQQDPEMASVKLEDCSQTLELNVNIKDEEEEEEIGKSVSLGAFWSNSKRAVTCLLLSGFRLATVPERPDWWSAAETVVLLEGFPPSPQRSSVSDHRLRRHLPDQGLSFISLD